MAYKITCTHCEKTIEHSCGSHLEKKEGYCEKNGHHYDGGETPFGKREKSICMTCCEEEPTTPEKTPEFCMESNCKKSDCQFHEGEMCCPECIGRISEPFPACHDKDCPCHQGESEGEEVKTTNLKIGMLRQWLNENRITDGKKMVTSEDIRYWLSL